MQIATPKTAETIRSNWLRVKEAVAEACLACEREAESVTVVGVSKYVVPELAAQLIEAGCNVLGENRPQSLWEKASFCEANNVAVAWHMIGHLQRNKIKRTLPLVQCLHSLDSLRLAQAVSQEALSVGASLPVLAEVNVTPDETKTGLPADALPEFVEQVLQLPGLQLRGLMAMSSLSGDLDTARREFELVRELRDDLQSRFASHSLALPELSMGMSGDFQPAIAAGATLVRIGSSLWQNVTN